MNCELLNISQPAQQQQQQCLLRVHAIFGLVPHNGLGAVQNLVRYFLATMGR